MIQRRSRSIITPEDRRLCSLTGTALRLAAAGSGAGGSAYAAAVLADDPVVYYRLGELTGTVINDASVNGFDGTLFSTDYTLGVAGALIGDADTAIAFAGGATGGWIRSPTNDTIPNAAEACTFEAWVKWSTSGNLAIGGIRSGANNDANRALEIMINGDTFGDIRARHGAVKAATTGVNYRDDVWRHIVATWDGADIRLYVNGIQKATNTTAVLGNTTNSLFEVATYAGTEFIGSIDEAACYAGALSAARILAHYNAGI